MVPVFSHETSQIGDDYPWGILVRVRLQGCASVSVGLSQAAAVLGDKQRWPHISKAQYLEHLQKLNQTGQLHASHLCRHRYTRSWKQRDGSIKEQTFARETSSCCAPLHMTVTADKWNWIRIGCLGGPFCIHAVRCIVVPVVPVHLLNVEVARVDMWKGGRTFTPGPGAYRGVARVEVRSGHRWQGRFEGGMKQVSGWFDTEEEAARAVDGWLYAAYGRCANATAVVLHRVPPASCFRVLVGACGLSVTPLLCLLGCVRVPGHALQRCAYSSSCACCSAAFFNFPEERKIQAASLALAPAPPAAPPGGVVAAQLEGPPQALQQQHHAPQAPALPQQHARVGGAPQAQAQPPPMLVRCAILSCLPAACTRTCGRSWFSHATARPFAR